MASLLEDFLFLIDELEDSNYGNISITSRRQENDQYISVAGLGVQAGGYKTVAEALRAWRETKEFGYNKRTLEVLAKTKDYDPEREHQKLFEELNS